ncbi:hypothetical protein GF342_02395 [Candidatus Woesearchaeota archaeon]|nr:hypothetical protein [Candidatus Woesearchaeota archaeon]
MVFNEDGSGTLKYVEIGDREESFPFSFSVDGDKISFAFENRSFTLIFVMREAATRTNDGAVFEEEVLELSCHPYEHLTAKDHSCATVIFFP